MAALLAAPVVLYTGRLVVDAAVKCGKVGWEARGLSPSGLPARSLEIHHGRFRSHFWLSLSLRVLGQPTLSSRSVLQCIRTPVHMVPTYLKI